MNITKKILTTLVLFSFIFGGFALAHNDHTDGIVIQISDESFFPSEAFVPKGTKVIFENSSIFLSIDEKLFA